MATNNAVNTSLSGQTGTGAFVGATSPSLVTPNIDVATATNITFSNYATGGVLGTTTNNNAATGYDGEVVTASNSGTVVSNGAPTNVASISLTAGDWDVYGNIQGSGSVFTTSVYAWISTTSVTLPSVPNYNTIQITAGGYGMDAPTKRISLSGTTTVYLGGVVTGSGTLTLYGTIYARRRR